MNIGALPELILSLFKHQGAESLQAAKDPAAQLKPGAQYEGRVLDSLPNGRNLVQVGNQAMDMALPKQAQPGEVVRLTFLGASPRPTFVLNTPPVASSQPVNLSQAAQQVNALVRYMPVSASAPLPGAATVTAVQIGQAAGLAPQPGAAVPGRAPAAAAAATATATTVASPAAQPPVAVAPGQAQAVAQAATLQNTPAPPAAAAAPNAALPQAAAAALPAARPIVANPAVLLAPAPAAANAVVSALPGPAIPAMTMSGEAVDGMHSALGSQSSSVTAQGVVAEKTAASHVLPMRLQQTVKESGLFYESHLGKWVRGEVGLETIQREPQARLLQSPGPLLDLPDLEGMPEQAARLASRQLHMLEGGPFLWQGQAWPGQEAEWQVAEREGGGTGDEAGQKWHSTLRLSLPRLGALAAELDIGALGLRIRLRSATPEALAEIKAALPELVQRMRAAELNLASVSAEMHDGGQ